MARRRRRRRYRPVDPFDAFLNAWGFHCAATVVSQRPEVKVFAYPKMVNAALALELFIKSLHLIRRRRAKAWGHDIEKLFKDLSKSDKKSITKHLENVLSSHPLKNEMLDAGILVDIESILLRSKGMFDKQRYWFEKPPLGRDSDGRATDAGIEPLTNAVYNFILELKPDWKERYEEYAKNGIDFTHHPIPT